MHGLAHVPNFIMNWVHEPSPCHSAAMDLSWTSKVAFGRFGQFMLVRCPVVSQQRQCFKIGLPSWPYLAVGFHQEHSRRTLGDACTVKMSTGSDVIVVCIAHDVFLIKEFTNELGHCVWHSTMTALLVDGITVQRLHSDVPCLEESCVMVVCFLLAGPFLF